MKLLTFLILTFSLLNQFSSLSLRCFDLFFNHVHPYDCCHYPKADTKKTTSDHCFSDCFESEDKCCVPDCIFNELKNFDNGKFSLEQTVNQYEADDHHTKWAKPLWEATVKDSIEKCREIVPVKLRANEPCKMPEFMYLTWTCEHQQNFLNCPTFENTTHCQKTRELVTTGDKCAIKYGNGSFMRQEFWFHDSIDEEDDWLDCVIWQLF